MGLRPDGSATGGVDGRVAVGDVHVHQGFVAEEVCFQVGRRHIGAVPHLGDVDLGLIVFLCHHRPIKADALQGEHQICQNILTLVGGVLLRLHGEQRPVIRENGGGMERLTVGEVYRNDIVPGCLI